MYSKLESSDNDPRFEACKLQAVAFEYDRTHWEVIDKSIAADFDGMAKLSPGVRLARRTHRGRQAVDSLATSTEQKPGDYGYGNLTSRKGTFPFRAVPSWRTTRWQR